MCIVYVHSKSHLLNFKTQTMKIKKLYPDVEIPQYATRGSAGFDLAIHNFKDDRVGNIELEPGCRMLVGCGFAVAVPSGQYLQIVSRSGKTLKEGLIVLNAPGVVDSDYRGEVGIILYNSSSKPITLNKGNKVAQGVLTMYYQNNFIEIEELDETERGEGGFGSTDTNNSL